METAVQPGAFGHGVPIIKDIPYLMGIFTVDRIVIGGVAIAAG